MNNPLQQFNFDDHNALRVIADDEGNPWFLGKDVCEILGYANHNEAIKYHCKEDGVAKCYPILDSLGRTQYPLFISEGNLYRLIIKSNKPEAEPFESWVCDEVLPSIRKHGYYVHPNAQPDNDSLNEVTGNLPFQRLNTVKLESLRKISKELAQAYLLECGITPDYVKSKIGLAGDYAAANIYGGAAAHGYLPSLVAAFVKSWQDGSLGAPFIHCQSGQALRLFMRYADNNGISVRHGENHIIEAFSQTPELYKKRVRLSKGQYANPKSIIMIHGLKTTEGQEQGGFVADCVSRMEAVLIHLKD